MDAWATEWTAARNDTVGVGREKLSCQNDAEESPVCVNKAPPFLWEGLPLVSTIIGQSGSIVAGASELRQWYGPGFPCGRNPFFLAYPIDDQPVTPQDVLVKAYVNGEVSMLMDSGYAEYWLVMGGVLTVAPIISGALLLGGLCTSPNNRF